MRNRPHHLLALFAGAAALMGSPSKATNPANIPANEIHATVKMGGTTLETPVKRTPLGTAYPAKNKHWWKPEPQKPRKHTNRLKLKAKARKKRIRAAR